MVCFARLSCLLLLKELHATSVSYIPIGRYFFGRSTTYHGNEMKSYEFGCPEKDEEEAPGGVSWTAAAGFGSMGFA